MLGLYCCAPAFSGSSEQRVILLCRAQAPHCGGFSCCRARVLGTRASVVAACRLSCPAAWGIFKDQGLNPYPLHWQSDSSPLDHHGSPLTNILSIHLFSYLRKFAVPNMQESWVQSLDWDDPLEKGMATHFSVLAWRIPWTEEPGGLPSMGPQRVGYD